MGQIRNTQQAVEVLYADAFTTPPRQWIETATSLALPVGAAVHAPARRYERFANGGLSSLSAGIDNDDRWLTVGSAAGFPAEGNFRIIVDTEIMLVARVLGNSFLVVRGQEGTSAASHDAGAAVYHVLTAGALAARDSDQAVVGTVANRDAAGQAGRLYVPMEGFAAQDTGAGWDLMPYWRFTPPPASDVPWAWVNQGGASIADNKGMTVLTAPTGAANNLRLRVKSAPATPYRITVAMIAQDPPMTSSYCGEWGVCWRDSVSAKIVTFGFGRYTDTWPVMQLAHTQWTNPTTVASSGQISHKRVVPQWPYWLRFGDDGTNRTVEVSGDGVTWQLYEAPEARTTFITADQVGFYVDDSASSKTPRRILSMLHWSESK